MRKLAIVLLMLATTASAAEVTTKGWFADEGCARGRAKSGIYAANNPECALKCVKGGAKLVFISEDQKAIWVVDNPEENVGHIGEYVSMRGTLDDDAKTVKVASVTFIDKVRPSCAMPKKSPKH
jgi:hypothetical protein